MATLMLIKNAGITQMKRYEDGKFLPILKERREKARYSQTDIAEILEVSQTIVSRWERGESYPRFPELKIMSELYGCTIEQLYVDLRK